MSESSLQRMLSIMRHRGPDGRGFYQADGFGLAQCRLGTVGDENTFGPIAGEGRRIWVACDGAIANYLELKADLTARGHQIRTPWDSEVIVHLYEELGVRCVERISGDFAFALWHAAERRLLLVRDRLGARPLFVSTAIPGRLLFASEVKALLTHPEMPRSVDLHALDQVFTYGLTLPGRTMFTGVSEVPPGHYLVAEREDVRVERYWSFAPGEDVSSPSSTSARDGYEGELCKALVASTQARLIANSPVGVVLDGGLGSTLVASILRHTTSYSLETFSLAGAGISEGDALCSTMAAQALGAKHRVLEVAEENIGAAFSDVVWHTESALLNTAPVLPFLLARFVHEHDLKVVLISAGASELLGPCAVEDEAKVRNLWARAMPSERRLATGEPTARRNAYAVNLQRLKRFLSPAVRAAVAKIDAKNELRTALPGIELAEGWTARTRLANVSLILPQLRLSSLADRVWMAHGIEVRSPFLDHGVIGSARRLARTQEQRDAGDLDLLLHACTDFVSPMLRRQRSGSSQFAGTAALLGLGKAPASEYAEELLSPSSLRAGGYFDVDATVELVQRVRREVRLVPWEAALLCAVLSVQIVRERFLIGSLDR